MTYNSLLVAVCTTESVKNQLYWQWSSTQVKISIRDYEQCLRCYFRESAGHSRVAASTEWCNFDGKLSFSLRSDQLLQVARRAAVFPCLPPTVPALSAATARPKSNRSAVVDSTTGSVQFAIVVLTNAPHVRAPVYYLKTWARHLYASRLPQQQCRRRVPQSGYRTASAEWRLMRHWHCSVGTCFAASRHLEALLLRQACMQPAGSLPTDVARACTELRT